MNVEREAAVDLEPRRSEGSELMTITVRATVLLLVLGSTEMASGDDRDGTTATVRVADRDALQALGPHAASNRATGGGLVACAAVESGAIAPGGASWSLQKPAAFTGLVEHYIESSEPPVTLDQLLRRSRDLRVYLETALS